MTNESAVDVTLVVEWEHVSEGEADRPVAMLQQVVSQSAAIDKKIEVLVAFDPDVTDRDEMELILTKAGLRDAAHLDVRLEPAPGHRYYALKNVGGERARGDIVVLMDSDVIPEPGWLRALIEPFDDPQVQIASGQIFVGPPKSTFWKAFSLFWLFEVEDKEGRPGLRKMGYHANNVAFRREVFLRHPFRPGVRTSPNTEHCDDVKRSGIPVYYTPAAKLVHPAPRDFGDMRTYAFSSGHDRAAKRAGSPALRVFWILASVLPLALDLVRYTRLIVPEHRRGAVGLSVAELPQALGLAYLYGLLRWAGFVITMAAPDLIPAKYSTGSSLAGWRLEPTASRGGAVPAGHGR